MAADDLLVEAGEIEGNGQGRPLGLQRLGIGLKAGFDHPLRRVRLAGAFVRCGKTDLPFVGELKHQGEGNGPVDGLEDGRIELRRSEGYLEYLDFVDAFARRQIDGFRCQLVLPEYFADLGDKEFLEPFQGPGVGVDLGLGHRAIELGLFRVGEHGVRSPRRRRRRRGSVRPECGDPG